MPALITTVADRYVSINAAAARLGATRHSILVAIAAKRLESEIVAGRIVISVANLERFRLKLDREASRARHPA